MNEIEKEIKQNIPARKETEVIDFYDWAEENPGKLEEDLRKLTGLEVLRIFEAELESNDFLRDLKKLKVLEFAEMFPEDDDVMRDIADNLEQLFVWSN